MDKDRMKVKRLSQRLAVATGKPEPLHAGQIRHWTQHGLFDFEVLQRSGDCLTSSNFYSRRHLAAACVYVLLVELGFSVERLKTLVPFMPVLSAMMLEPLTIGFLVRLDESGCVLGARPVTTPKLGRSGEVRLNILSASSFTVVGIPEEMRPVLGHFS